MKKQRRKSIDRRTFVKVLPAAGAAVIAASHAPLSVLAQTASPTPSPAANPSPTPSPTPGRIKKNDLEHAEKIIGIDLSDKHREMALTGVNTNLDRYEAVRKIDVPLDTEPAVLFHPQLPGFHVKRARVKTKFRFGRNEPAQFKSVEDLAFATVPQLAQLIRTRKVSSVELTRMYLSRLKKYGPKLLCIVTLTEDLAMKQAQDADNDLKRGKYRGPLHGIPWGAKDLFATKGIKTTWGAEPYRDQMIDYDATVIERLRDAGAVLVAKLSMGALAQGPKWFGGVTRNPWVPNEDRQGASGSSAGPGAATAAGLVGFSIGTETLGSIISPSSRNGVVGLRPTYGRVSRYGAMGLSWTMDKIGPMCRGVEDCAAALDAIYGPDGRDITVGDAPFNWNADLPLSSLRVGYLKAEFETTPLPNATEQQKRIAAQRNAMYKEALDALVKAGVKLTPIELPKFPTANLRYILTAEAATAFDDITRDGRVNQLSGQDPGDWPNTFRTNRFVPAVEYLRAQRARVLLMREMDKLMRDWDVFVSPAPGSASLLITNLTGHPAVCLPCGFLDFPATPNAPAQHLPQAIMFTGGLYDEASPLRVALAFEKATKWHTMHPKVDWA